MTTKNERLDISMRILGARQMEREGERGAKAVKKPGEAARFTQKETTKLGKANSYLTRSYGALGKAAKYGLGFLGVTGVFALEQAVTNTEELSKTTVGLNRNLNIGTSVASKYAAVAYGRGIAANQLNMAFTKLGKTFVEANRKGGTARTGLNQLGITQAQTEKGAHNFNYALELVAKQFGKAKGGPERQAAALSLLGKGYATVLPMFSSGVKGLKEQESWADKYGVTLSGKTNSALMEMVEAQRESKVAMLGLQVSLTKALMPAIEAGEGELQKFIATLNDPKLSAAQKVTAIEHQFESLENKVFTVLDRMAPGIAEHAGRLGIQIAIGLWQGFWKSDAIGKLAIGGWLFKSMGGLSLIRKTGGEAGQAAGAGFATKFILYATLAILGFELARVINEKTNGEFRQWGINAGQNFVNALIWVINKGIQGINKTLAQANALSFLGVEAPEIGEIGSVNFHHESEHAGPGGKAVQKAANELPPGPAHLGFEGKKPPKPKPRRNFIDLVSRPIHVHTHIDGKEVAVSVARHGERAAARA